MHEKKYQIFISSTYEDLKDEREAAIKTILSLDHIPIGMEMFNAGDEEQWEIIRRTIDTSDYYVVIIGFRYGSIALDGISYTEKEYDYALKSGIPILAFIKDENAPSIPSQREDSTVLNNSLIAFKKKVKKKILKFWVDKGDFTTQLSTSLQAEIKRNPRTGWIPDIWGINENNDITIEEFFQISYDGKFTQSYVRLKKNPLIKNKELFTIEDDEENYIATIAITNAKKDESIEAKVINIDRQYNSYIMQNDKEFISRLSIKPGIKNEFIQFTQPQNNPFFPRK